MSATTGPVSDWFDVAVQIPGIEAPSFVNEAESAGHPCSGACSHCCTWDQMCVPFDAADGHYAELRQRLDVFADRLIDDHIDQL